MRKRTTSPSGSSAPSTTAGVPSRVTLMVATVGKRTALEMTRFGGAPTGHRGGTSGHPHETESSLGPPAERRLFRNAPGTVLAEGSDRQGGEQMSKRTMGYCAALLFSAAGLFYQAFGATVTGSNCKVKCQDVATPCFTKSRAPHSNTQCKTHLAHCS